jgi:hypothetical protein
VPNNEEKVKSFWTHSENTYKTEKLNLVKNFGLSG